MRIGAVGYNPYIYNTNSISSVSLDKVAAIEEDLTASGTDYTSLIDDAANENPLKMGETSDFMDVLQMQYQMGQRNAARLIKPAEEAEDILKQDANREPKSDDNLYMKQRAAEAYSINMIA